MTGAERQARYMARLRGRVAGSPPPLLIELAAAALTQATSERAAFQDWFAAQMMPAGRSDWFGLDRDGDYATDIVQAAWEAWRARAVHDG
jgi:hypothetical protein